MKRARQANLDIQGNVPIAIGSASSMTTKKNINR